MNRTGLGHLFDLSDVAGAPVDTLDEVLDVAAEVVFEFGPDPGSSRIERLARYLALNLGGEPFAGIPSNSVLEFELDDGPHPRRVWQRKGILGIEHCSVLTVEDARSVVVALLRCIERAEGR